MIDIIFFLITFCIMSLVIVLYRRLRFVSGQVSRLRQELKHSIESIQKLQVQQMRDAKFLDLIELHNRHSVAVQNFRLRSQFGEDLVLLDFFGAQSKGFFVEAGGYDGLQFSATAVFEAIGWKGVLVEPHPQLFAKCLKNRPGSTVVQAALGRTDEVGEVSFTCVDFGEDGSPLSFRADSSDSEHLQRCKSENGTFSDIMVPVLSLDKICEPLTGRIDILILDIEGHELNAIKGLTLAKFQPRVLLIEVHWTEADLELREYLAAQGYVSSGIIGCNEFFCSASDREKLKGLIDRILSCPN